MKEEYFTFKEGNATYVCRKEKGLCTILAQHSKKTDRWVRYRNPSFWTNISKEEYERLEYTPITKAEVTAIFLMGKSEAEI